MDNRGDGVHVSATEARGGSKDGVVRWVLIIGTLLAIVLLTLIWTGGALFQDEGADSETNVERTGTPAATSTGIAGSPTMPAIDSGASPTAAATPGDAPAGDPKPDAQ